MFSQLVSFVALATLLLPVPSLAVPGAAWVRRQEDAQQSLTLDPAVISHGLEQDGQGDNPDPGQVRSLTSGNNFINFCLPFLDKGVVLTNGQQVVAGSCNQTPMGRIISLDLAPRSKFVFPRNGDTSIQPNTAFTVKMKLINMQAGNFVNAATNYYAAPQQVNDQGIVIGHTHFVIEPLPSLKTTQPLDPLKFAFFKGINDPVDGDNIVQTTVTNGLAAGFYRLCSINTAANHQPCLVSNAQHGALDDCSYFTIGNPDGNNNNNNAASSSANIAENTSTTATNVSASTTRAEATESASTTASATESTSESESASTTVSTSDAASTTDVASSDVASTTDVASSTDAASTSDTSTDAPQATQSTPENEADSTSVSSTEEAQSSSTPAPDSTNSTESPAPTESSSADNGNGNNGENQGNNGGNNEGNNGGNNEGNNGGNQGDNQSAPSSDDGASSPAPTDNTPAPTDNTPAPSDAASSDNAAPSDNAPTDNGSPAPTSDASPAPTPDAAQGNNEGQGQGNNEGQGNGDNTGNQQGGDAPSSTA